LVYVAGLRPASELEPKSEPDRVGSVPPAAAVEGERPRFELRVRPRGAAGRGLGVRRRKAGVAVAGAGAEHVVAGDVQGGPGDR